MRSTGRGIKTLCKNQQLQISSKAALFSCVLSLLILLADGGLRAQQPTEPMDPTPLNGESYYFLNQLSAMQMDLNSNSVIAGDVILQNPGSFTNVSQRWAITKIPSGNWKISSLMNGFCLDGAMASGTVSVVQNPCKVNEASQEWKLTYTSNGYNAIVNASSGDALDIAGSSTSAGAHLDQSSLSASPTQSQQWLLRPVFYRGNDNAIQEKEEALRVTGLSPWWQDAGQAQDLLQILKNHGFNMVRIRPTSAPPYQTYTLGSSAVQPATCSGNGCYAETDAADLDLAKRAKQLGMSVELSLFFDGGSSVASPGAWAGYTVAQTKTAIYNYTKAEVEAYRSASVMPDLVSIGNEVDTGFFGSIGGSPSGPANSTAYMNFAAYETAGLQAVTDAASDTSIGAAIPPPVRCIHITPAWDLTSFFSEANTDSIPYDAICQSYYPIFHGPLTSAQATASNPNNKPIEQTALTNAVNSIGKPIFIIETGEHYENGDNSNDPWYAATRVGQRQFILDLESVLKGLPKNLALGMEYWDSAGTNIGSSNGDGKTDGIFIWNGLTLFDNADTNGSASGTYNAVLPALSAVGGKLDPSLSYMLINAGDGRILETALASTVSGAALDTALDSGVPSQHQEWQITSNNDGYFQIANVNPASTANVLDTKGATTAGSAVVQMSASAGTASQEWDVVTAGNGYFAIVNKVSGLVLSTSAGSGAADTLQQQAPASMNIDWITTAGSNQMWQVVPAHIVAASTPAALAFDPATVTSIVAGASPGSVNVDIQNTAGAAIGSPAESVTLTITGPGSFNQSATTISANGMAVFNLGNVVLDTSGTYTLTATSSGLSSATTSLAVIATTPTTTVLVAPSGSIYDASVTLTATVTGTAGTPAPTGSVTFKDGTSTLGSGTLNSTTGIATYSATSLAVGPHSFTATYISDTYNASSLSNTVTFTVSPVQSSTSVVSSASSALLGSNVTFTATVTGSTSPLPTASVTFKDGNTILGSSNLNAMGVATLATIALTAGPNSVTAIYAGDTDNTPSTSNAVSVTIAVAPGLSVSLSPASATVTNGGSATSTVGVAPLNGFASSTTLSCSGLPTYATCTFNPTSVTPNAAAATSIMTIATNVQVASMEKPHSNVFPPWLATVGSGALLALILWPTTIARKCRTFPLHIAGLLILVAIMDQALLGCGGGGSSAITPPVLPKTPTGQYSVIVTGTSGTLTGTASFELTVQ